ncbi:uncharacterized protein LOC133480144 [Phyllopteryx taeniolatus]|uniref:uncharacterized protein LOC133480144 n=1 Tax=Phyllopteryx taeniolatus TaxID=161469 RepID=UPI002AD56743|nr:uncharacterized protein LOC133480144 [Phyllopteryx taeniolatus]
MLPALSPIRGSAGVLMKLPDLTPAVGGPVQRLTWSEGVNPVVGDEAAAGRSSFYRLPVFWHASQPLVAKELLRPAPRQSLVPSELTALLFPQTTQYQSMPQGPRTRPVEVWCGSNEIVVRVDRFQLRAWPHPALYNLGSCQPTSVTSHFLFFHYALTDCGSASQVLASGQLVYSYVLYYSPLPQGYIIRELPFKLPIHCYYNRFHYSYQVGYVPQVQHTTFIKSLRTKLRFSLTVCNAQWEPLSPGHSFVLGEPVNFVAQTGSLLPGEKLFVDSCYVTHSKNPNSMPKVDIITNYGCMTESRREGSSSSFWSRSGSMLKFSINAFLFRDVSQVLYLHCSMSVGVTTSHSSKSCNYNKTSARWEELDAPMSMCSCCDSICGKMQDSVKNTVISPGWLTHQKNEEGSSMKDSPFQSEEQQDWVDQKELRKHKGHFTKIETFSSVTKMEHKTSVFPDREEVLRPRTAISMSSTNNQEWMEEGLPTLTDSQRTEPKQDVFESREVASSAYNGSMRGSFSDNSTVTPRGASRNTTFTAQNSSIDLGSAEKNSTDLIAIAELCSNIDKSCPPKAGMIKVGSRNTSAEHTHLIRTTASDTTRLELSAGEQSANSKAKTDSPEFDDVSESSESRFWSQTLDTTLFVSTDKLIGRQLERIPEPAAYYADSKGLDGAVLQGLQIKEMESDLSANFKGPTCVDKSNSGIEDEVLHHGQFAVTAKTKKEADDYFGVASGSPSFEEVLDNADHSAVMIVTSKCMKAGTYLTRSGP